MVALITPAEKPFARELATFYAQRSSAMFSRRVLGVARRFQEVIDAFFIGGPFHGKDLHIKWRNFARTMEWSVMSVLAGFPQLAVAGTSAPHQHQPFPVKSAVEPSEKSFLDTLRDGFLWAVPKKRTSLEKRVKKQFGKSYMDKFRLRTDLIVCLHCGNHHEAHALCGKFFFHLPYYCGINYTVREARRCSELHRRSFYFWNSEAC